MGEKSDSRKSDNPRLIPFPSTIPLVMVVLSVLLVGLLYILIVSLAPAPQESGDPCALSANATSHTEATVSLAPRELPGPGKPSCRTDMLERLFEEAWPLALRIVLANNTHSGNYTFQSFQEGDLVQKSGDVMGTISYRDLANNNKLDYGDRLLLENLGRNSIYRLEIVWDPTGEVIAIANFRT